VIPLQPYRRVNQLLDISVTRPLWVIQHHPVTVGLHTVIFPLVIWGLRRSPQHPRLGGVYGEVVWGVPQHNISDRSSRVDRVGIRSYANDFAAHRISLGTQYSVLLSLRGSNYCTYRYSGVTHPLACPATRRFIYAYITVMRLGRCGVGLSYDTVRNQCLWGARHATRSSCSTRDELVTRMRDM